MDDRRTFGGIVGMALEVYGQRFGTLFAIALVGQFLWALGGAFLGEVKWWEGPLLNNLALVAAGAMALLLGLIPRAMQVPALLSAVSEGYRGTPVTIGGAFDRASARLTWETAWANIIATWLALGGLIAGVAPGIVFGVWFCLADVVVVLEGERDLSALKRSQWLVRGHGGKTLALIIAGILAGALPGSLVRIMVEGTPGGLLSGLMGIFTTPFQYGLYVLLYYDLKARKEEREGRETPSPTLRGEQGGRGAEAGSPPPEEGRP